MFFTEVIQLEMTKKKIKKIMKLNLPEQKAPIEGATPNHPRKLKKVLSALPNTNMGRTNQANVHHIT